MKKEPDTEALYQLFEKIALPANQPLVKRMFQDFAIIAGFSLVNQLPRAKKCGNVEAAKELEDLSKAVGRVRKIINKMHRTSLEPFETKDTETFHPLLVDRDLELLVNCATKASKKLRKKKEGFRGRRPAVTATQITQRLAEVYEALSGERATRIYDPNDHITYSPFIDFLKEAFSCLRLENQATSQAKIYVKNRQ